MGSSFALPITTQQEEFSRAYIAAIASAAGFSAERRSVDMDCIDISIHQRSDGKEVPLIDSLGIQSKCTYAHAPKDGFLPFPLDVATYNNLRQERLACPRILVVVHVPREVGEWLTNEVDAITLRYCAYWLCLRGMAATQNTETITIKIPVTQRFTVEVLQQLMARLAKGEQV